MSILIFQAYLPKYQGKKVNSVNVQQQIHKMSFQEKEYLTNFFKYTFFLSGFGYTIYGDKPMSFETINIIEEPKKIDDIDYMDIHHIFDRYRLKEGWAAWNKHFKSYPLKGFTIISYTFPFDSNYIEVTIINHSRFIKAVTDYLDDFQKVLGKNLTPQQILEGYIKGEGFIFTTTRHHDGLFGILLGFGRENSWEYMLQKGGKKMKGCFQDYPEPRDVTHILPPSFCILENTQETKNLRESYENQKKKIDAIFQRNDFLEQVLNHLIQ